MAFSMFLRNPACTNLLRQQLSQLAMQPALTQRSVTSALSVKSITLNETKTPILDSVRSFRTSTVRLSDEKPHDHSKLWVIEKATSAAMVPLIPLGLLMPNRIFDSVLAILITAHSFWGLEAMVVEYVRVLLFGPLLPKIAMGVVYSLSVLILGGLFYLNFNDVGLCRGFWKIWRNMRKPKDTRPPAPPVAPQVVFLYYGVVGMLQGVWRENGVHATPIVGLEAIAVDYVRASIFGPLIPKIAIGLVYALCIATLGGLFYLISHDIGLCNSIRQLWAIKSEKKA